MNGITAPVEGAQNYKDDVKITACAVAGKVTWK